MRKLLMLPLMMALAGGCWGQMTPYYDTYTTYSLDSNLVIYQTVVVEGYTSTPTGSCNTTCCQGSSYPPYYSCWSCPMPGCASSTHTPSVENVLGSTGGWSTGPPSDPFAYMSYQTTTSIQAQDGQGGIGSATDASVVCSVVGTIFGPPPGRGHVGISETNYTYAPPPSGNVCAYSKNCPVGQTATCGVGTIYYAAPCSPQFLELYFGWYNIGSGTVCLRAGPVLGDNLPGDCD